VDELQIDIPQREDPIARRQHPRIGEYMARLMDRLDIGEDMLRGAVQGAA
jgi:hypothetical protein